MSNQDLAGNAWNNLMRDSPRAVRSWAIATGEGYLVLVEAGECDGDTLAKTVIHTDHAQIVMDIDKIMNCRDNLEAVLGHEIFHVQFARERGWDNFFATAERDKDHAWHDRELEQQAIAEENLLRGELIATGMPTYEFVAPTRDLANRRATIFKSRNLR